MDKTTTQREGGIGQAAGSMITVMLLTMLSKVAGFLRETVLASRFGATAATDAFKTAELVPCILLSVVVTAISATLIPAYAGQVKLSRDKADRFINNLLTVGTILSAVILVLTAIFIEPITNFVTSASDDAETRALAVQLARLMMPMGIFVFLARVISAYLQANYNFTMPALSQVFLNLVIVGAIFLSQGVSITYVAIGTVAGWALQFAVQLPAARRAGLRYRPIIDLKESGLREVLVLMLPVLISGAFDQVYILFDKMVALRGAVGDLTALDLANRVSTMVSAVLLTTVATVLYPSLVRDVDNKSGFRDSLRFGINVNLLIALPAMAAIILLRQPMTSLVYQRGAYGAEATALTANILACYAAGILGVGLRELCNRAFYAYKDTKIPMIVGVCIVVENIVLNFALHSLLGPSGIALATAISSMTSGGVLLFLLHRKRGVVDGRRVLGCLWRTAVATGAMAAVLVLLAGVLGLAGRTGMALVPGLLVTCVAGVLVYAGMLLLLRTEELTELVGFVKKKLGR